MPPISRTWYNTLVNDDGSGLTGSIWDKEDVNQLIIATDAAIAGVEPGWTLYTPVLYAAVGTWSASGPYAKYRVEGHGARQITLMFSIEASSLSAQTGAISIQMPLAPALWSGIAMGVCATYLVGSYEANFFSIQNGSAVLDIVRPGGQYFPATTGLYVRGQLFYHI
jgi:hypothetical protein